MIEPLLKEWDEENYYQSFDLGEPYDWSLM